MIDVLVIGAGPTGLLMAAEAARYGMTCRIIDKIKKPSDKSRALAIQPRTLEIFDYLDIVDSFIKEGTKIQRGNQYCKAQRLVQVHFDQLDTDYPFVLSIEQSKTEHILAEYLKSFGLEIERETEMIDLQDRGDKAWALCQKSDGKKEEIEARWLIGCDGAHSLTRKKLKFPFLGKAFPSALSLADVKIKWKYPHDELSIFLNPDGLLVAIPMPGENRYRVVFELERCRNLLKEEYAETHGQIKTDKVPDPSLEEVSAIVAKHGDPNAIVSAPVWLANFHINTRLVESYQKGRIFLAGDAAHIHSPAGGQGMNSGLQDAFNLAWKLSSKNQSLIDTYSEERRSWGKRLLKTTRIFTRIATLRNPIAAALRNTLMRTIGPKIQKKAAAAISQISIRYPKSRIAFESGSFAGGPSPGMRAVNIPVNGTDLYFIIRKTKAHHLLVFGFDVGQLLDFHLREMQVLEMDHFDAFKRYGVKNQAIYIIRPDLIIGYRSSQINFEEIRFYYRGCCEA